MVVGRIVSVGQWIARIASDWRGIATVLARAAIRNASQVRPTRRPEHSDVSMLLSELSTHAHPHKSRLCRGIYRWL